MRSSSYFVLSGLWVWFNLGRLVRCAEAVIIIALAVIALNAYLIRPAVDPGHSLSNAGTSAVDARVGTAFGVAHVNNVIVSTIVLIPAAVDVTVGPGIAVNGVCGGFYRDTGNPPDVYRSMPADVGVSEGSRILMIARGDDRFDWGTYGLGQSFGADATTGDVTFQSQPTIWQAGYNGSIFPAYGTGLGEIPTLVTYLPNMPLSTVVPVLFSTAQPSIASPTGPAVTNPTPPTPPTSTKSGASSAVDVPEPVSSALLTTGLIGIAWLRRRRAS